MKSYIFRLKILVIIASALLVSCEDLQDINKTPNGVTDIPDGYLFTNAAKWSLSESRQTTSRGQVFFTGCWSHMLYTPYAEDKYQQNTDTDDENMLWSDIYGTSLSQSNQLLKLVSPDGTDPNPVKYAMTEILTFISYIKLTDLYGNIPYTEGGKGISDNIIQPKYNTQEYIYKDIIAKLGECVAVFDTANKNKGFLSADPFFAGDMTQWEKFANSFRLRLAMRMRFVEPTLAATTIGECLAKPLMTSNADNVRILNFVSNVGYLYNGWYDVSLNEGKSSRPSQMLIDQLVSTNDPRLPIFAQKNTGGYYKGMPNGIISALPNDSISAWASVLFAKDMPSYWLCYSEVCFLKAEAAVFNIAGAASSIDANAEYQKGIEAAMLQWGVVQADADNFIANESAATLTGTDEQKFAQISTQMWLSCITNYYEAYNVVRRTGYPFIADRTGNESPYPLNTGNTNGKLPRRITYPSSESATNQVNLDEAIALQGPDDRLTNLWWDAKTK